MADATQSDLSNAETARRALTDWRPDDDIMTPQAAKRWHMGSACNRLPDKLLLRAMGMRAYAEGWLPAEPIIRPETRVIAVGSCFAQYFVLWLAEHGFNKNIRQSPYNALLRFASGFENPAVIAQQFRWAFGELENEAVHWVDKSQNTFEATDERRQLVRDTLLATDVLIITLGLSEVWYDRITGEPLWRTLPVNQFDPQRHVFRVESMAQMLTWLETIERLRAQHIPNMRIVFTVSPVRLQTTFRPISAFSANNASKAIVRAALDEFLRGHQALLNRNLFYFPSYEFVTDYFVDPYENDNLHISSMVAASIVRFFVDHYCSAEMIERTGESLKNHDGGEHLERFILGSRIASADPRSRELLTKVAELEDEVVGLRQTRDQQQRVIQELDTAARERQRVIQELDTAARERLDLVRRLDADIGQLRSRWWILRRIFRALLGLSGREQKKAE